MIFILYDLKQDFVLDNHLTYTQNNIYMKLREMKKQNINCVNKRLQINQQNST